MFLLIANTPRDYAWGSLTEIADLLGRTPSGGPEGEYWLGTHPGSPSRILDPAKAGGDEFLAQLTTLPFLLKVLAASAPLSLQAHPTPEQARDGFARENAEGIPLTDPRRNYKDDKHKPELIYALSAEYHALCGFRSVAATRQLLAPLGQDARTRVLLDRLVDDASLPDVFEWLISRGDGVEDLIAAVVELAVGQAGLEFANVAVLAEAYPGDPGIVIALLLNYVVLAPGEVLYLPAGNIHMYLKGLGIELMAASDNVLRGGLTPKHIDIPELLKVLDFRPLPVPYLRPTSPSAGVEEFRPDVPDFELVVVTPQGGPATFTLATNAIVLAVEGEAQITGQTGSMHLERGDAAYVSADEGDLTLTGSATVFLATSNRA